MTIVEIPEYTAVIICLEDFMVFETEHIRPFAACLHHPVFFKDVKLSRFKAFVAKNIRFEIFVKLFI